MYSTRYINKNKVDGNAYLAIGDQYKDPIPNQFRQPKKGEKQPKTFRTAMVPVNAENGHFTKTTYIATKYQASSNYIETQPMKDRKNAFGSHDATKRDEFSSNIRTEQYRQAIKAESKHDKTPEELAEELEELKKASALAAPKEKSKYADPVFSFDIGRTRINEYDPKSKIDTFYKFDDSSGKFFGSQRPGSCDYGNGAWEYNYKPPPFGGKSSTKTFYDKSHLKVGGY